jgi:sulfite reductase (NADPH) hemoprotein beta-component
MKALTANRLSDGEVVFWAQGAWVERFGEAEAIEDDSRAETVEALARAQVTQIVDPYLIDIQPVADGFAPISYRERVRALGPTNKPDHGKQAIGGGDVELLNRAHGSARSSGRVNLIKRK